MNIIVLLKIGCKGTTFRSYSEGDSPFSHFFSPLHKKNLQNPLPVAGKALPLHSLKENVHSDGGVAQLVRASDS